MNASFILNKSPVFTMGKRQAFSSQDVLVSIPTYMKLNGMLDVPIADLKFEYCTLKLKEDAKSEERAKMISEFSQIADVTDVKEEEEDFRSVIDTLDVIFTVIIALSMFLCFFSLISSTSANMMEQTKEIGVLRATGFNKFMIKRLYFYETFVLVFSSSLLGILVGTTVGWTMTVQQAEFISLPIVFFFPYKHLFVTSMISIACAFIATYSPTSFILNKNISEIFRIN